LTIGAGAARAARSQVRAGVPRRGHRSRKRQGAMLLEVLISIAILAVTIATIGSQVNQSLQAAAYTDKLNRALMLAEWVLAEMDLGTDEEDRLIDLIGEEGEGAFGERYPGFGWRIEVEPTDVDNLDLVILDILHGDPESESVEDWRVLHSVYALRPVMAEVDPSDFGMPSEEEIGLLASATPPTDGGGGIGDLPPGLEELLAALPTSVQEIMQRLLSGEPVPLDEIRAAYAELTVEDLLGILTVPGLLDMVGVNMGGMPSSLGNMGAGMGGLGGGLGGLLGGLFGGGDTGPSGRDDGADADGSRRNRPDAAPRE